MRKLIQISLILLVIVSMRVNAQNSCSVFITSNFESQCVLTTEKDDALKENEGLMLACKESTVEYYANSQNVTSYNWTITGALNYTLINNGTGVRVNWGNNLNGQVKVRVFAQNGNVCESTKYITLIEKPQIASSSIPTYKWENGIKVIEVCLGEDVIFTNESSTTNTDIIGHYWESIYGASSTENYKIESIMQETQVLHKVINNCGCESEETYEIRILKGKKLELSCYGTVCEGAEVTYDVLNTNCNKYHWFVEDGIIKAGQGSPKIRVEWSNPQRGYGIIGIDGDLCDDVCPKPMSVKIPIISNGVEIEGQETACIGDAVVYSLPLWGSTEYNWTITPSQGVVKNNYNNANQTLIQFNTPGTYYLTATYKCDFLECGPFSSQTKTIIVKPKLTIDTERDKLCEGQSATFTLNNNTITAAWKIYKENGQQIHSTQSNTLTYTFLQAGKYRITASHSNFCNIAEYLINVKSPPPAPTTAEVSPDIIYACLNSSISLNGTPSSVLYGLIWEPSTTAGTPAEVSGNKVTIDFTTSLCDINVYQYDKELGCRSTAYIKQIQPFTLEDINIPNTIDVCAGSYIEFLNNQVPNQSPDVLYEWTVNPQNAATIEGSHISNNVKLLVNDLGVASNTFTIILNRNYCTDIFDERTINVTVISPPTTAPSIVPPNSKCVNTSLSFGIGTTTPPDGIYTWTVDNNRVYSGVEMNHAFYMTGNHLVELEYKPYQFCPSVKSSTIINIEGLPFFELRGNGGQGTTIDIYPPIPTCANPNTPDYLIYWKYNGNPLSGYSAGANPSVCTETASGCASIPYLGAGEYCCKVVGYNSGCEVEYCKTIPSSTNPGVEPPCYNLPISVISNTLCLDQKAIVQATNPTSNDISWSVNPQNSILTNTTSNSTEIQFSNVGNYTIVGYVSDGDDCYTGTYIVTVSCILKLELKYDCSTNKIIIKDKSKYLNPANVGQRQCTIIGTGVNQVLNFPPGVFQIESNAISLPITPTTYTVTIYYDNCPKSQTITLSPPFSSLNISTSLSNLSPFNSCEKTPIELIVTTLPTGSANSINKIHWDFGDGSTNITSGNTVFHTFNIDFSTYLVTATITDANNCTNIFGTISIQSNENTFSSGELKYQLPTVCEGSAKQIYFEPAAENYQWYNPLNYTTSTPSTNVFYTGDYTVLATNSFGCIKEAMTNVGFKNTPTATIVGKTEYCNGDEIKLSGDLGVQGINYSWLVTNPDGTSISYNTNKISFTAISTGNYTMGTSNNYHFDNQINSCIFV